MSKPDDVERELRERLGIPTDAARVLVFAESSHWDPDWLLTSEEYYRLRVRKILDGMVHWLSREPRRVYSVEGVYFLRMYWERNPDRREVIRKWVNQGRIRLSGSGINTPDTILPPLEAVLRDYLHGQQWLLENGMTQEPRLAYLPDNFGNTPALPTLLRALGCRYAAMSRIDGIFFPGSDYRRREDYPLPGSSAALLLEEARSADFVWRDMNGSEVLCHLNPFTYGQGDTLVHGGPFRWMGLTPGLSRRALDLERSIKRIERYIRQLSPYSPTPYMFCPIGFDFNEPVPHLVAVLDEFNRLVYPEKGVFAVNASLEDYLDLVSVHRERLPVLSIDPNPYFTGFYASRPEAKQRWKAVVRDLLAAEMLLVDEELGSGRSDTAGLWRRIRELWDAALMANHHDFVTGTAPRRVWEREQKPLLIKWQREAGEILMEASAKVARPGDVPSALPPPSTLPPPARPGGGKSVSASPSTVKGPGKPRWKMEKELLRVETSRYLLELDARRGGCLTRLADLARGADVLSGPGNDIVVYEDSGGLWRMGQEYRGGVFREKDRTSRDRASIRIRENGPVLEVEIVAEPEGCRVTRRVCCREHSPVIGMRVEGRTPDHRTAVVRFPLSRGVACLLMDVNGGLASRPPEKLYRPTFWAASSLVLPVHDEGEPDVAFYLGGPACVSCSPDGTVELAAMRNAPGERAFGLLPLLSFPARGPDRNRQELEYALVLPPDAPGPASHETSTLFPPSSTYLRFWREISPWLTHASRELIAEGAFILSAKRALRGEGYIVRLYYPLPPQGPVTLSRRSGGITRAFLCDAHERDLEELEVIDGRAFIPMSSTLATVRMIT